MGSVDLGFATDLVAFLVAGFATLAEGLLLSFKLAILVAEFDLVLLGLLSTLEGILVGYDCVIVKLSSFTPPFNFSHLLYQV